MWCIGAVVVAFALFAGGAVCGRRRRHDRHQHYDDCDVLDDYYSPGEIYRECTMFYPFSIGPNRLYLSGCLANDAREAMKVCQVNKMELARIPYGHLPALQRALVRANNSAAYAGSPPAMAYIILTDNAGKEGKAMVYTSCGDLIKPMSRHCGCPPCGQVLCEYPCRSEKGVKSETSHRESDSCSTHKDVDSESSVRRRGRMPAIRVNCPMGPVLVTGPLARCLDKNANTVSPSLFAKICRAGGNCDPYDDRRYVDGYYYGDDYSDYYGDSCSRESSSYY